MRDRELRPWIYAALDGLLAAVCLALGHAVFSSDGSFRKLSCGLAAASLCAAIGTASRRRAGWWVAVGGCGVLAATAVLLLTLLVGSVGYLHGTFGQLGKGAAAVALAAGALAMAVYGLLPGLQLAYLLSREGRRAAGWPARAAEARGQG